MRPSGEVWRVCRGDEVVGEITITGADFPWLSGRFAARPAFAAVAPLIADELALLERCLDSDDYVEAWEAAYQRVADTVRLVAPAGPVAQFLLHIDGDEAWFRWSDE
jgi:hypothetical protein